MKNTSKYDHSKMSFITESWKQARQDLFHSLKAIIKLQNDDMFCKCLQPIASGWLKLNPAYKGTLQIRRNSIQHIKVHFKSKCCMSATSCSPIISLFQIWQNTDNSMYLLNAGPADHSLPITFIVKIRVGKKSRNYFQWQLGLLFWKKTFANAQAEARK